MADKTLIAWTDHTFNPWMGCEKVSEGCRNCYALTLTTNRMGKALWGKTAPRQVTDGPWKNVQKWDREAARLGAIHRVFTGSLCDIFEDHPTANEVRQDVWYLIRRCQNLHFQLLTKRPQNILRMLPADWSNGWNNVWLGTSVEDMRVAERADILRSIPAAVRFVSYEPALGPLDSLDLTGIDWVIFGGESGAGFRAADPQWSRDMKAHCERHGVAYFHKQFSHLYTERGIELDGQIVRNYPTPRLVSA